MSVRVEIAIFYTETKFYDCKAGERERERETDREGERVKPSLYSSTKFKWRLVLSMLVTT